MPRARGLLERSGEVAFDLFDRHAGLEPAGNLDVPVGRIVEAVLRPDRVERLRRDHELPLDREWHPHVAHRVRHPLDAEIRRRQYADDCGRRGVQPYGLADDRRIAAEAPLPERVADHRDRLGAGLFVGIFDRAADMAETPSTLK